MDALLNCLLIKIIYSSNSTSKYWNHGGPWIVAPPTIVGWGSVTGSLSQISLQLFACEFSCGFCHATLALNIKTLSIKKNIYKNILFFIFFDQNMSIISLLFKKIRIYFLYYDLIKFNYCTVYLLNANLFLLTRLKYYC